MNFEDFLLSHEVTNCGDYNGKEVIEFMRQTWNAAKEDSKDKAEIIYVDYPCSGLTKNNGNPFWTVRNTCASVFFDTQTEAENWALEQGYRLE